MSVLFLKNHMCICQMYRQLLTALTNLYFSYVSIFQALQVAVMRDLAVDALDYISAALVNPFLTVRKRGKGNANVYCVLTTCMLVLDTQSCDRQNGGCAHVCKATRVGDYECSCRLGYLLSHNGKDCNGRIYFLHLQF